MEVGFDGWRLTYCLHLSNVEQLLSMRKQVCKCSSFWSNVKKEQVRVVGTPVNPTVSTTANSAVIS